MTRWNASPLRPWCRFGHPANEQKDRFEEAFPSKDVKYEGRSGDMYENKDMHDKMPDEKTDITAELKLVAWQNAPCVQLNCTKWRFRDAVCERKWAGSIPSAACP